MRFLPLIVFVVGASIYPASLEWMRATGNFSFIGLWVAAGLTVIVTVSSYFLSRRMGKPN